MLARPHEHTTQTRPLGAADVVPEVVADHRHFPSRQTTKLPDPLGEEGPRRLAGHQRTLLDAELQGGDIGARIEHHPGRSEPPAVLMHGHEPRPATEQCEGRLHVPGRELVAGIAHHHGRGARARIGGLIVAEQPQTFEFDLGVRRQQDVQRPRSETTARVGRSRRCRADDPLGWDGQVRPCRVREISWPCSPSRCWWRPGTGCPPHRAQRGPPPLPRWVRFAGPVRRPCRATGRGHLRADREVQDRARTKASCADRRTSPRGWSGPRRITRGPNGPRRVAGRRRPP